MTPLHERAKGRWYGILSCLGIDRGFLTKRNGPCPMCGGRDRWRWTDHNGTGAWICNKCGHGTGIDLVMAFFRTDFKGAAERIEEVVGKAEAAPKHDRSAEDMRAAMRKVWDVGQPVTVGNPVGLYLAKRGIVLPRFPSALRYVPRLRHQDGTFPAMVAQVTAPDGEVANVHRTWLTDDGAKAPVDPCRKMMAGTVPPGSAVRLYRHAPKMGIAEGIETALRAAMLFRMPVWSVIAEGNMQKFRPPAGVEELWVFGDNDNHFAGQAAAYIAARDIIRECERGGRHVVVKVAIPDIDGADWADIMDFPNKTAEARMAMSQ